MLSEKARTIGFQRQLDRSQKVDPLGLEYSSSSRELRIDEKEEDAAVRNTKF